MVIDQGTKIEKECLLIEDTESEKHTAKASNCCTPKQVLITIVTIIVASLFSIIVTKNEIAEKYDKNDFASPNPIASEVQNSMITDEHYSFNIPTSIKKFVLIAIPTFGNSIPYKYDPAGLTTQLMYSDVFNINTSDANSGLAVKVLESSNPFGETCEITRDVTIYSYRDRLDHDNKLSINIYRNGFNIGQLINRNPSNLNDSQIFYIINDYGGVKLRKGDILHLQCDQTISDADLSSKEHKVCGQYIMYYSFDVDTAEYMGNMCKNIIISSNQLENGRYFSHPFPSQHNIDLPEAHSLGQVPGVATSINGNEMYVLARRENKYNAHQIINSDTIFVLDAKTGQVKKQFGKNLLITPHGLACDHYGNLWVTDTSLHQIFRIDPTNGNVTLTLGTARVTGWTSYLFNRPTDVVVDPKRDEVYISDGYGNCRVAVFSYNGTYLREWGEHKRGNGIGQFNIVHNVAIDILRDQIFVADRQNCRVQIFDRFGNILQVWKTKDLYCEVPLPVVDSWRGHLSSVAYSAYLDMIITIEGAYVVGRNPENGKRMFSFGNASVFHWPHDVDIALNEKLPSIYVAELNSNRMQRLCNVQKMLDHT